MRKAKVWLNLGALTLAAVVAAACALAGVVESDRLVAVFVGSFAVLSIAAELVFSAVKRERFKETYQSLDALNPESAHRPTPRALIIMAAIGLIGSLLLGMPVLPYVFAGLIAMFVMHAVLKK